MSETITSIMVCQDCIMVIANDEGTVEHKDRMGVHMVEMHETVLSAVVPGDDVDTFSKDNCEGCGSDLAGYRHEAVILRG
jgi:hypothetical protein